MTASRAARRVACSLAPAAAPIPAPASATGLEEPVRWHFGVDHGQRTARASARLAFDPRVDLEEARRGGAVVLRVDLDGDGAKEHLVGTACGNGGCASPIFRGGGGALLGTIFGAAVWTLGRSVRGMPVIRTDAHVRASAGLVRAHAFDGKGERFVSATALGPEGHDTLFRARMTVPKPWASWHRRLAAPGLPRRRRSTKFPSFLGGCVSSPKPLSGADRDPEPRSGPGAGRACAQGNCDLSHCFALTAGIRFEQWFKF